MDGFQHVGVGAGYGGLELHQHQAVVAVHDRVEHPVRDAKRALPRGPAAQPASGEASLRGGGEFGSDDVGDVAAEHRVGAEQACGIAARGDDGPPVQRVHHQQRAMGLDGAWDVDRLQGAEVGSGQRRDDRVVALVIGHERLALRGGQFDSVTS